MNVLLHLFVFLSIIAVPAHARILSESAGSKLALIITIYGRKPPSPPPSPSSSPPTHHSTIGATASLPPAPPHTKPIGQRTSYKGTRSPPPSPKPAPSHGQLGSSTSPCNRIISMESEHSVRKPRSPPPSLKLLLIGSDNRNTRSPPPPPKPAPSHGQLGRSASPCNRTISTVTEHCVRKPRSPPPSLKLFIGTDYGNTRSPPPPPNAAPSHGQLGITSPWNRIISIATDSGWIKLPRSSPSIVQDK